jgi:NADH-quinone oxidoreductase subunit G
MPRARIAASLMSGEKKAVLLGALAQNHPQCRATACLAQAIADASGATLGFLSPAANSVGAQVVGCCPARTAWVRGPCWMRRARPMS